MSESEISPVVPGNSVGLSGGAMLRKAREAQGLHIAALAVSLKVPVKKLEALEADRFDLLPDTVFARALASSVCRSLKIDAGPILAGLPLNIEKHPAMQQEGINVPFRASRDGMGSSLSGQLSKPMVLAVLLLLLGAVAMVFYPLGSLISPSDAPASDRATDRALPVSSQTLVQETPVPVQVVASATTSAPLALTPERSAATTAAPTPVQQASAPAALPNADPALKPATASLSLNARAASWVEVVDARGVVQLRKTLAPGEATTVAGVAPLAVVVGRADAVDVQASGGLLNLAPLTKDNVARFEVKQ